MCCGARPTSWSGFLGTFFSSPPLPPFLPFWIDSVNSIWAKRFFLKASGLRLWFVSVGRLCPLAFPLTEVFAQQLKGHCAGGQQGETGRVSVILEQGDPLQMIQLLQSPWEDRFRVSHFYFQPLAVSAPARCSGEKRSRFLCVLHTRTGVS